MSGEYKGKVDKKTLLRVFDNILPLWHGGCSVGEIADMMFPPPRPDDTAEWTVKMVIMSKTAPPMTVTAAEQEFDRRYPTGRLLQA